MDSTQGQSKQIIDLKKNIYFKPSSPNLYFINIRHLPKEYKNKGTLRITQEDGKIEKIEIDLQSNEILVIL